MLYPVSDEEIIETLRLLKWKKEGGKFKKCSDMDDANIWHIKQCSDKLVESLKILIDSSYSEGIFPTKLKNVGVIPLFKERKS